MPKPLIKVLGKEIIFWLLDSLKTNESDNIFIPYNEHLEYFNFSEIIQSKYPNIQLTPIPNTRGASESILLGLENFNINNLDYKNEKDVFGNFTANFKESMLGPNTKLIYR